MVSLPTVKHGTWKRIGRFDPWILMAFPQNPFTVWAFVFDVTELMKAEQMPIAATKCAEGQKGWDNGADPRILPGFAANSNRGCSFSCNLNITMRTLH